MTIWCTALEAMQAVQSGNRIFIQGACATPAPLIEALVSRGDTLRDVEITHLHTYGPTPYTDARWAGHFSLRALFVAENTRAAANAGRASYTPVFLSDVQALFAPGGLLPIDIAFLQLSQIDYAVSWQGSLFTVPQQPPNAIQTQIGRQVAELIEDGATLQLGIGAIPDAMLKALGDRRDLGIHSEMVSDGILDLVEQGVITGATKPIDRGKIVASFVVGSQRLLDFIDDNPMVELRPADYTNDTRIIRQFERMVAVNSAIQVDLTGQVCAESVGSRLYSGVGGQMDFSRGAALAQHGRPIIAMPATAAAPVEAHAAREAPETPPSGPFHLPPIAGLVSRIVPILTPGAAVTTSRAHVHYVVTEYGIAPLHGRDLAERARNLIAIAAPQFRESLERAAYQLHLLS